MREKLKMNMGEKTEQRIPVRGSEGRNEEDEENYERMNWRGDGRQGMRI